MKKALTIVLFSSLFALAGITQNLVDNFSFEQYNSCPNAGSQITYANGWEAFSGTPDYFDSCSFAGYVSVPENIFSYRNAFDGGAYCGINSYIQGDSSYSAASREIVGRQLSQTLTIGQKYYVSFKVTLVLNSNMGVNLATNKLGMLFSTIPYTNIDSSTIPPINNFAHVYTDSVISDTLNWSTISGSFIADSSYRYLSIGCFFKYQNLTILAPISTPWVPSAYYFVDNVVVTKDTANEIEEHLLQDNIKVYFNSADNNLFIQQNMLQNSTIKIYNIIGQLLMQLPIESNKFFSIDFSNKPNGIYIVSIQTKDGSISKKIIK